MRRLLDALDRFLVEASRSSKARMERGLERAMEAGFKAQGRAFDRAAGRPVDPDRAPDASAFEQPLIEATLAASDDMARAIETSAGEALVAGAQAAMADFGMGIAFDLDNARAVAYLRDYGASRVTQINETTRTRMRRLIAGMVDDGRSYDEIARAIKKRWREMAIGKPQQHIDSRAHLIAVTEIGEAYEAGSLAAVQDMANLGLAMEKSWLTVGDERVSAGCQENEAAGWIPLNDDFPSGHARPLRFPGCRCTALYRRTV